VTAIHPQAKAFENTTVTGVADFVISRLTTRPARLSVNAPRNFPQLVPITVFNSAGVEAINNPSTIHQQSQESAFTLGHALFAKKRAFCVEASVEKCAP